jgi:hypothetical protein
MVLWEPNRKILELESMVLDVTIVSIHDGADVYRARGRGLCAKFRHFKRPWARVFGFDLIPLERRILKTQAFVLRGECEIGEILLQ